MNIEKPKNPINPDDDKNLKRAHEALSVQSEVHQDIEKFQQRISDTWDKAQHILEENKKLREKGEKIRHELKESGQWNDENQEYYEGMQHFMADAEKEQARKMQAAENALRSIASNAQEIQQEIRRRQSKN